MFRAISTDDTWACDVTPSQDWDKSYITKFRLAVGTGLVRFPDPLGNLTRPDLVQFGCYISLVVFESIS